MRMIKPYEMKDYGGNDDMRKSLTPQASQILAFSKEEAIRLSSPSIGPGHLLLAMMRERTGFFKEIFRDFKVDETTLKQDTETEIRRGGMDLSITEESIQLDEKAGDIINIAIMEANHFHASSVDERHLFLAILHENFNIASKLLKQHDLSYENVLDYVTHMAHQDIQDGLLLSPDNHRIDDDDDDEDDEEWSSRGKGSRYSQKLKKRYVTPVLDKFSTDLTEAASKGELDPVVEREEEIKRVSEILCRRKKNNPILLGEPGVGKSAIVEGLAQRIVAHKTSPLLFDKRVVSLDMTSIVAGTKFRGQFEERLKALMDELEKYPDIIMFIDEIHLIIGAGGTPGSMDAANILKPALSRGKLQCIGATTYKEYNNSIGKDGALERRFQKVPIKETDTEETLEILKNIRERYEKHHCVSYSDEILELCVRLSNRYVNDRYFPDKAIDVMDEVGARAHLLHASVPDEITLKEQEVQEMTSKKNLAVQNQKFELAAEFRDEQSKLSTELEKMLEEWRLRVDEERVTVDKEAVAAVVSSMSGVPVQRMVEEESLRLKNLAGELRKSVIAQDTAIEKLVKAIQRNRIGLRDPNHPIGAFMFLGPTGVGKTYLCKKLAEQMFGSVDALIRVDMSEYAESFNTSRLVGAPPGYVGYEEGGQLTERVRRHPYSIVLLDEIEKAHGNVFNMLLQVLDEGRLTDGNGRLVDFRHTVIIMTSNAGTRQLKDFGRGVGFNAGGLSGLSVNEKDKEYARSVIQKSLEKQFAPEFLNRLDEIITFDQLDLNAIIQIVDIELRGLISHIDSLGYHLEVSDSAKEFVANKGYDVQYGARPLKRAIQNYIEDAVCELLLYDNMQVGDTIIVERKDGESLDVRKS